MCDLRAGMWESPAALPLLLNFGDGENVCVQVVRTLMQTWCSVTQYMAGKEFTKLMSYIPPETGPKTREDSLQVV